MYRHGPRRAVFNEGRSISHLCGSHAKLDVLCNQLLQAEDATGISVHSLCKSTAYISAHCAFGCVVMYTRRCALCGRWLVQETVSTGTMSLRQGPVLPLDQFSYSLT